MIHLKNLLPLSLCGALIVTALGGCERPRVAGAMIINTTDAPITVTLLEEPEGYGPWTIEPGLDGMAIGAPGPVNLSVALQNGERHTVAVTLSMEHLALLPATPQACIALTDYTDQYGGDGRVEVIATGSHQAPGQLVSLGHSYLGPGAPLPSDRPKERDVIRFTIVPCDLLDAPQRLKAHLWGLD